MSNFLDGWEERIVKMGELYTKRQNKINRYEAKFYELNSSQRLQLQNWKDANLKLKMRIDNIYKKVDELWD